MRLTYAEVGATRDAALPPGYHHVERDVAVGHGTGAFGRAGEALFTWAMQRGAGLRVPAGTPRAAEGVDVVFRAGPLKVPCRVVYTVDEQDRRGYAYGTLPGHPERGEEAFLVTMDTSGAVRLRVRAFSRPATLLARLGGPGTWLAQRLATDRYVAAVRRAAGVDSPH